MQGKIGVVTVPIAELEPGQVKVGGEMWTARSFYDGESLPVGTRVEVVEGRGRHGARDRRHPRPHQIDETKEASDAELIALGALVILVLVLMAMAVRVIQQSYVGIVAADRPLPADDRPGRPPARADARPGRAWWST